jgi:Flp pilus assembly protein TadG
MFGSGKMQARAARGFLTSLARNTRGNTLAMLAAMLIPMSALAGSAIDVARVYVVKVRLQQACDAGVLAGRKFMLSTDGATLDANATTQANNFFTNNFRSGWMGTTAVKFTPVKANASEVSGTALATIPMTIMRMFGFQQQAVSTTCTARYDVADTDVMFVLDTTGSMACLPGGSDSCGTGTYTYKRPSGSGVPGYAGSTAVATTEYTSKGTNGSRIEALRQAVLAFYDTFAANADPSTNVRYGFVTYSSSVNVGQAILDKSANYLVGSQGPSDMPYYQTRQVYGDYETKNAGVYTSSTDKANGKSQSNCTAPGTRTPSTPLTYDPSTGTAQKVNYDEWASSGSGKNKTTACYTRSSGTFGPQWQYNRYQMDVSKLVSGSTTMTDPTKVQGQTLQWYGCVETPVDNPGQSTFTTSNLPSELNPDLKPSGSQRWWPHLQDAEYVRSGSGTDYTNGDDNSNNYYMGYSSQLNSGYVSCGKPAKRLGVMTRNDVYNYVYATDFVPEGGTYHDIGMIWGARLISPNGAWADDTAAWSGHNPPNRVIVFMTDGVMAPDPSIYSMYGLEQYDKRVANGDSSNLTDYHNSRFLAACAAAKARNIDVWTVSIASSATTQMQQCATTSAQALYTTTGAGLTTAFQTIAQHLAMLRITQ